MVFFVLLDNFTQIPRTIKSKDGYKQDSIVNKMLLIKKHKTIPTFPSSPLMDLAVSKNPGTWLGTSSLLKYHTWRDSFSVIQWSLKS